MARAAGSRPNLKDKLQACVMDFLTGDHARLEHRISSRVIIEHGGQCPVGYQPTCQTLPGLPRGPRRVLPKTKFGLNLQINDCVYYCFYLETGGVRSTNQYFF